MYGMMIIITIIMMASINSMTMMMVYLCAKEGHGSREENMQQLRDDKSFYRGMRLAPVLGGMRKRNIFD